MTDQQYLDICAMEAMNGLLVSPNTPDCPLDLNYSDFIASLSYTFAQSMLAERKNRYQTNQ